MRPFKNIRILPMFLTVFIDFLGATIVIPVLAPLLLNPNTGLFTNFSTSQHKALILGFLLAAYPLAQFFGAPLLGSLSDRFGRRKILLLSLAGTVIGYTMLSYGIIVKNIFLLFAARLLDGFTGGNVSTVNSAVADISDEKNKTKNFGIIGAAFGIGFIVGPFLGGYLSDPKIVSWFNYATPFWFQTILAIINIIFVILFFPETLKIRKDTKLNILSGMQGIFGAFRLHNLRVIFLINFILSFSFNLFVQFFTAFLVAKFSLKQSQIGNLFAYIGIWVAISQLVFIRYTSAKFKPSAVIKYAIFGMGAGLIALLLPHRRIDLYIILPLVAVLWGLIQPNISTIVSNLAGKDSQGEVMGVGQSLASLSQIIPPIVDGIIFSISINMPIIVASGLCFMGWLIFLVYYNNRLRQKFSMI